MCIVCIGGRVCIVCIVCVVCIMCIAANDGRRVCVCAGGGKYIIRQQQ